MHFEKLIDIKHACLKFFHFNQTKYYTFHSSINYSMFFSDKKHKSTNKITMFKKLNLLCDPHPLTINMGLNSPKQDIIALHI